MAEKSILKANKIMSRELHFLALSGVEGLGICRNLLLLFACPLLSGLGVLAFQRDGVLMWCGGTEGIALRLHFQVGRM